MSHVQLISKGELQFILWADPPQNQQLFKKAFSRLKSGLEKVTGKKVANCPDREIDLVLVLDANAKLEREEFYIDATINKLSLCATNPRSLEQAVSYFLEKAFGQRWLWPGELGRHIPDVDEASWPLGRTRHEPAFAWRRFGVGGAIWTEFDYDYAETHFVGLEEKTQEEYREWCEHNRLGGLNIRDGHCLVQLLSAREFGESHPEYFALVNGERDCVYKDGKHGNHPCTTNPEVVDIISERVIRIFKNNPELDAFSIALNDGIGFCECERCRDFDREIGATEHELDSVDVVTEETQWTRNSGLSITDRVFDFSNRIAARVAEIFPEKKLLMLIYSFYRDPPKKIQLSNNIIAQFCTPSPDYLNTDFKAKETGTLEQLSKQIEHVGIYDYFEFGWRGGVSPLFTQNTIDMVKNLHKNGVKLYASQVGNNFSLNAPQYYLLAHLLWDPEQDAAALLEEFYHCSFGPAAGAMRSFYELLESRWSAFRGSSMKSPPIEALLESLYPATVLMELRTSIEHARQACHEEIHHQRVDWVESGLDYLESFCELTRLMNETEALFEKCHEGKNKLTGHELELARRVVDKQERFFSKVENLKGRFVYSEFWLHYMAFKRSATMKRLTALAQLLDRDHALAATTLLSISSHIHSQTPKGLE